MSADNSDREGSDSPENTKTPQGAEGAEVADVTPDQDQDQDKDKDKDKEFQWKFKAPDWFTEHHVRFWPNVVDPHSTILWTEEGFNESSIVNGTTNGTNVTNDSHEASGFQGRVEEGNANVSAPVNGDQDCHQFTAPRKLYSELHDMVAGALVTNSEGSFIFDHSTIVLKSDSTDSIDFTDAMIASLAQEMHADLISFNLEDLEDIAEEFESQEIELQSNADKDEVAENKSPKKKATKHAKKSKKSHRRLSSGLTEQFFCPASPSDRYYSSSSDSDGGSNGASKRNHGAISGILEVSGPEERKTISPETVEAPHVETQGLSPNFIHIRNANSILQLGRTGYRCINGFRSWIEQRRASGRPMILFVSISTGRARSDRNSSRDPFDRDSSRNACDCPSCDSGSRVRERDLQDELHVDEASTLTIDATDISQENKALKAKERRELYGRKLRRALRQKLPRKSLNGSMDILSPYPARDFVHCEEIAAALTNAKICDKSVRRAVRQICGRTLGKSTLDIDDIRTVLLRIHGQSKAIKEPEDTFSDLLSEMREKCDDYEGQLLSCVVDPKELQTTYDDVIMDPETKETVKHLISFSKLCGEGSAPHFLQQIRTKGAMFYGPPGTGKTHLCRAIAKESGSNMLAVDAANIENKFVGETEKAIKATFSLSIKLHPCILFIDEADALFRRRTPDDRSWERNAITLFLQEMDGLNTTEKRPFVVVATNRPSDLDEAFSRRLPHKVLFSLPSENERAKILRLLLKEEDLDSSITIEQIASDTPRFSGADLRDLCGQATLACAMDQGQLNKHQQSTADIKLSLNKEHFAKARRRTRPSVSRQIQNNIEQFQDRSSGPSAPVEMGHKHMAPR